MFLHPGNIAVINYKVLVAEGVASFREHDPAVTGLLNFFYSEFHGGAAEELPLLDVHDFSGGSGCLQEICLSAKKGRYLQDVDKRRCQRSFRCGMDIGGSG